MQGYQSSMRDTPEGQNEPLISPVNAAGHTYSQTTYETAMSAVGNVMGSICCCMAYQSVNRGEVGWLLSMATTSKVRRKDCIMST